MDVARCDLVAARSLPYMRLELGAIGEELARLVGETTVRLAVTGLSGAGKTVFITSLIHNLLSAASTPAALPALRVVARGTLLGARIASDAAIAQRHFPYARLIQSLAENPPRWPESTTGTSQIRVSLRSRTQHLVWRQLASLATLNLDIVDYPGEWLLDLPLLEKSFAQWSAETLELCRRAPRDEAARDWLGFIAAHGASSAASEDTARSASELYRAFLLRCRTEHGLSLLQPGRLLSPGEFEGAPVLWFCPLPVGTAAPRPGTLHALMESRFDAYKTQVVERFYRDYFGRFDRQVVLVDVLRALDTGRHAFEDARAALAAVLGSFRFGRSSLLARLIGGARIDKVLFLATKADHVTPAHYANLRQLLEQMMVDARIGMRFEGGAVETKIVAAVRCTELGTGLFDGKPVGMLVGTLVGEEQPRVLFPGEVPPTPPDPVDWATNRPDFPAFRPPRVDPKPIAGIPQIGLDDALETLIGDRFP
jgi:predicted YcjX-like family ATPase